MPQFDASNIRDHTLYFVRHGETDWNAQKRIQGHQDIPLNEVGRRQASEAGTCLGWLNREIATFDFIASPLMRARETMKILRGALGLVPDSYRQDDRLQELSFGRWEGLTWDQIRVIDEPGYLRREADPMNFVMPGGESYAILLERVRGFLATLKRDSVLVSHGGVCRVLLVLLAGVAPEAVPTLNIPQDRVLVLRGGRFAWLQARAELQVR